MADSWGAKAGVRVGGSGAGEYVDKDGRKAAFRKMKSTCKANKVLSTCIALQAWFIRITDWLYLHPCCAQACTN
jgi:hypothetical protein